MSLKLTMDAGEAEDVMYILEDYISDKEEVLIDNRSCGCLDDEALEIERANLATAIRFHERLVDLLGLTEKNDTDETLTNQQGG